MPEGREVIVRALALALVLTGCSCSTVPVATIQSAEQRLAYDNGVCSGTAVGPHLILTAEHCQTDGGTLQSVNGRSVHVLKVSRDGRDHVIVSVDISFAHWLRLNPRPLALGERLRFIGHPGGAVTPVYREAIVAALEGDKVFLQTDGWRGDSGSALVDDSGAVVGVISAITYEGPFALMVAQRLEP